MSLTPSYRTVGIFLIATGICLGAIGAHLLRDMLPQYYLDVFNKGVFYQLINGLGLITIANIPLASQKISGGLASKNLSSLLITIGAIIFSTSLYLLSILQIKIFGAITPIGGLIMIAGWLHLLVVSFNSDRQK